MFERQCKLSLISIKLYLSAARCLNALWLNEVLAILKSISFSSFFISSVLECLLFVFHCVARHKASLVNCLAQQNLSCTIIYK